MPQPAGRRGPPARIVFAIRRRGCVIFVVCLVWYFPLIKIYRQLLLFLRVVPRIGWQLHGGQRRALDAGFGVGEEADLEPAPVLAQQRGKGVPCAIQRGNMRLAANLAHLRQMLRIHILQAIRVGSSGGKRVDRGRDREPSLPIKAAPISLAACIRSGSRDSPAARKMTLRPQ